MGEHIKELGVVVGPDGSRRPAYKMKDPGKFLFDKKGSAKFRDEMVKVVEAWAKEHYPTVSIKHSRCNYTFTGLETKVAIDFTTTDMDGLTPEAAAWNQIADKPYEHDMKREQLGQTFRHQGHSFKITGYADNSPKFCIVTERDDGKEFFFPRSALKRLGQSAVDKMKLS
jgi:hypothetical protein